MFLKQQYNPSNVFIHVKSKKGHCTVIIQYLHKLFIMYISDIFSFYLNPLGYLSENTICISIMSYIQLKYGQNINDHESLLLSFCFVYHWLFNYSS